MSNPMLHIFNRLGYGPRPADFDVKSGGLADYVEGQLMPETLPDPGIESRLGQFDTLRLSPLEVLDRYQTRRDQRIVRQELTAARLIRAIHSTRQLQEVMTDFWFNHFNVFAGKGACRILVSSYERDAIRPHVFGKFRDLVSATARHPAMLFYLDNWMSVGSRVGPRSRLRGLNENYARELMELHTVGVDGGYSQQDVIDVARAFSGWTIEGVQRPKFVFRPRMHDTNPKSVLGRRIDRSGMGDGQAVIDLLVEQHSTARFISSKLVRRFVADEPPAALVARVARTYEQTDGDIRQMLRVIFQSREFTESETIKVKTPLELVFSAIRRLGMDVQNPEPVANVLVRLGQPLYGAVAPTGYPDTAMDWMSPGSLMTRLNYITQLAAGRTPGVGPSDWKPQEVLQTLGTPEFQRR